MTIGSQVVGRDMSGNSISGIIENVVRTFGVAIVRVGADRINVCTAYMNDLKEVQ